MNKAAQQLGRMARGKKKNLSPQEIERRTKRLADARKKRWPAKDGISSANAEVSDAKRSEH